MKPHALKQHDLVGVVAPAGPLLDPAALERGVRFLEEVGFRVTLGKKVSRRLGYLAGTDAERLADLMGMFADRAVKAIICARGGYGSTRLLPHLDYGLIRKNPKIFVGYSDITALHTALRQKAGLVTFLGPMVAPDFGTHLSQYTRDSFLKAVTCRGPLGRIANPPQAPPPTVILPGRVTGRLVGGNLSLLTATMGTRYELDTKGTILLLEDVGEDPYRIDRMLTQLKQSGKLAAARGIIVGECVECDPKNGQTKAGTSFPLAAVLAEHLGGLGTPCLYGLPLGHGVHKATVPLGLMATMDTDPAALVFEEAAVT